MITTGREFNTMHEAAEAFNKAKEAYEVGYGFYPVRIPGHDLAHPSNPCIGHINGVFYFTYSRGASCD